MTIVADHPLNWPAFASIAKSEQAVSAASTELNGSVNEFVEDCRRAGVELLRVPLSYAPSDAVAGGRYFVVKQVAKRGGSPRYYVTAECSPIWGVFPVGSGPHYGDNADATREEFGHFNHGEHVFVGVLDGDAVLVAVPPIQPDPAGGSASTCPSFSWCTEDHSAPHTDMSFHIAADQREPAPGVLRTDIVRDGDVLTVEVCDTLDWRVPMQEAPQLVAALRKEADRIEERLQEFSGSSVEAQGVAA